MNTDDFLPYTHPRFQPGTPVYIDEAIRERWPTHPLAGKQSKACQGEYSPFLESFPGEEHHSTIVPVEALVPTATSGKFYYIPEKYVREASEQQVPQS